MVAHPLGYAEEIHRYVGLLLNLACHPLELVPDVALTVEVVSQGGRGTAFVEDVYFVGAGRAERCTRAPGRGPSRQSREDPMVAAETGCLASVTQVTPTAPEVDPEGEETRHEDAHRRRVDELG